MTTDTLIKTQRREPDQRHPQGRAAVEPGRAYRHHQLRCAPDRRGDGQDELHQPRPRRAPPASTTRCSRTPTARSSWSSPARPRPAAAWTSMPSWCAPTWSTRSSPPGPPSSTWISSKRLATSTTKRLKSLTMIRCARSTSTASTTPISTRSSCRIATSPSARSPTASSRGPIRRAPSSARWASGWSRQRQEGQQPGQARLRA